MKKVLSAVLILFILTSCSVSEVEEVFEMCNLGDLDTSYIQYKINDNGIVVWGMNSETIISNNEGVKTGNYEGLGNSISSDTTYSPNGDSISYFVRTDKGKKLMKNGKQIGREYKDITNIVYSPDGEDILFVGGKDVDNKVVVKNGEELFGEYKSISQLQYALDGERLYFKAKNEGDKYVLIQDGKKIFGEYNDIKSLIIQNNGEEDIITFIESYYNEEEIGLGLFVPLNDQAKKFVVIQNGEVLTSEYAYISNFIYLVDSDEMYILADTEGLSMTHLKEGKIQNIYQPIYNVVYSPNNDGVVFILQNQDGNKEIIMKNGKEIGGEYNEVYTIRYLSNGIDIVYSVIDENNLVTYFKNGDRVWGEYDFISRGLYAPNSKDYVIGLQENEQGLYKYIYHQEDKKISGLFDKSYSIEYLNNDVFLISSTEIYSNNCRIFNID